MHPVLNQWLLDEASIEEVLTNLKSANFDPEFCKKNEEDIIRQFNQQFGTNISVSRNRWWQELIHA